MFRQLYDIEDRAKELSADDRLTLRQAESVPVLNRMRTYLDSGAVSLPYVLPKSDFAQAVNYLNNHWEQLSLFTTSGRIPIDNNDVEQLMKQVAVGRKNWLFLGSPDAGTRAATLLTLISTACEMIWTCGLTSGLFWTAARRVDRLCLPASRHLETAAPRIRPHLPLRRTPRHRQPHQTHPCPTPTTERQKNNSAR